MYNETTLQAATTISALTIWANDATGGILLGLFMIAIFIVMLFVLKPWDFELGLATSGLSCFILSMFLTYMDVLNFIFPLAFLTITAFSGFYIYMTRG